MARLYDWSENCKKLIKAHNYQTISKFQISNKMKICFLKKIKMAY